MSKKVGGVCKAFLHCILLGGIAGVVIGCCVKFFGMLGSFIFSLYTEGSTLDKVFFMVTVMLLIFVGYYLVKMRPSIEGSSVPGTERMIRLNQPLNYTEDTGSLFVATTISYLAGFPLACEGPLMSISTRLGQAVNDGMKDNDHDFIVISSCLAFLCIFLSPLAALIYIFEETLHKFQPKLILKAIVTICVTFVVSMCIVQTRFFTFETFHDIDQHGLAMVPILFASCFILAELYLLLVGWWHRFCYRYKDKPVMKYRIFILAPLCIVACYFFIKYMGTSQYLINDIEAVTTIGLAIGLLVFRFLYTTLFLGGGAAGGVKLPTMAVGLLIGLCIGLLYFGDTFVYPNILLAGMCMFVAFVYRTPWTFAVLYSSYIVANTGFASIVHPFNLLVIVSIVVGTYISEFFFHRTGGSLYGRLVYNHYNEERKRTLRARVLE